MLDDRRALDSYLNSRSPTVKDVQGHFVKDVLGLDKAFTDRGTLHRTSPQTPNPVYSEVLDWMRKDGSWIGNGLEKFSGIISQPTLREKPGVGTAGPCEAS